MVDHSLHLGGYANRKTGQGGAGQGGARAWLGRNGRFLLAGLVVAALVLSACAVMVTPGQAVVVTRLGDPVRVLTRPGLAWRLPAPLETVIPVDLRLRTTSSGLQDVGTRDGLRILVQAYVAWQVPDDPDHVRQFLRAVRNDPDMAAEQLRSFIGSSLEISVSNYDLANLINTDPSKVQLRRLEDALRARIDREALKVYGVRIRQVGVERMTLPTETLQATVTRMQAERATVAAQREAEGNQAAAQITSDADRDSRVLLGQSRAQAADVEAKSKVEAARIYAQAYGADPALYTLLRSLDTLDTVINNNTRLVLRTDAAPFQALVQNPGQAGAGPSAGRRK
jgi:membrane protease subunit HflC